MTVTTEYSAWQDVFEQLLDDIVKDSWHFSTQEIYDEYVSNYGDKEYFCKSIISFARRLNSIIAGIKGYTVEPKRTDKKKGYVITRIETQQEDSNPEPEQKLSQEPEKQKPATRKFYVSPYVSLSKVDIEQKRKDKILAEIAEIME